VPAGGTHRNIGRRRRLPPCALAARHAPEVRLQRAAHARAPVQRLALGVQSVQRSGRAPPQQGPAGAGGACLPARMRDATAQAAVRGAGGGGPLGEGARAKRAGPPPARARANAAAGRRSSRGTTGSVFGRRAGARARECDAGRPCAAAAAADRHNVQLQSGVARVVAGPA